MQLCHLGEYLHLLAKAIVVHTMAQVAFTKASVDTILDSTQPQGEKCKIKHISGGNV